MQAERRHRQQEELQMYQNAQRENEERRKRQRLEDSAEPPGRPFAFPTGQTQTQEARERAAAENRHLLEEYEQLKQTRAAERQRE